MKQVKLNPELIISLLLIITCLYGISYSTNIIYSELSKAVLILVSVNLCRTVSYNSTPIKK